MVLLSTFLHALHNLNPRKLEVAHKAATDTTSLLGLHHDLQKQTVTMTTHTHHVISWLYLGNHGNHSNLIMVSIFVRFIVYWRCVGVFLAAAICFTDWLSCCKFYTSCTLHASFLALVCHVQVWIITWYIVCWTIRCFYYRSPFHQVLLC